MPMLKGREIVIGVSGGIAAYKSAALVSLLVQQGAQVTAVLTRNAKRFIGAATFAALTGRPVATQSFDPGRYPLGAHIELAAQADLVIVAPATADFLAKAAAGMADDLLTTLYLCAQSPVLVAPAMNSAMWAKPAVQRNVLQLSADGVTIIQPGTGWLSCRQHGAGRMAEPEEIATVIRQLLSAHSANPSSHS
ncbi:MAG: phosphopantothenoylcysteine decarboxylase [Planctomycetota bacterium]|nr:MAG: phosphopantothenoylcysteine decarboxylase [Planctomycetota bacterium]